MSTAVKSAIRAYLIADTFLRTKLAPDPNPINPGDPAIFSGVLSNIAAPVYPCVTFRTSTVTDDKRFGPGLAGTPGVDDPPGTTYVTSERVDFEVWVQSGTSTLIEQIGARFRAYLHRKRFEIDGGNVVSSREVTNQPDLPGATKHARMGLFSYILTVEWSLS